MKKVLLASLALVLTLGTFATTEAVQQCPRPGISCPDVYNPVTCSNGQTYGNACYAYVACATGCSSGGV